MVELIDLGLENEKAWRNKRDQEEEGEKEGENLVPWSFAINGGKVQSLSQYISQSETLNIFSSS